mmetsp:Transcript_23313/g.41744  ORF Transcript_23313/g.41744 Transcript_23313/m.41744 type:complete len:213 (-) Transcript_23313:476-1114(-)
MVPLLHKNPSGYGPNVMPIRPQLRSTNIMERILEGKPISDRKPTRRARRYPDIRESEGIVRGDVDISTHWPSYCRLLFATGGGVDVMLLPLPSLMFASNTAGTGSNHRCKSSMFAMMSMASLVSNLELLASDGNTSISTTYLSWRILVARTDVRGGGRGRDVSVCLERDAKGFRDRQKCSPEPLRVSSAPSPVFASSASSPIPGNASCSATL